MPLSLWRRILTPLLTSILRLLILYLIVLDDLCLLSRGRCSLEFGEQFPAESSRALVRSVVKLRSLGGLFEFHNSLYDVFSVHRFLRLVDGERGIPKDTPVTVDCQ